MLSLFLGFQSIIHILFWRLSFLQPGAPDFLGTFWLLEVDAEAFPPNFSLLFFLGSLKSLLFGDFLAKVWDSSEHSYLFFPPQWFLVISVDVLAHFLKFSDI